VCQEKSREIQIFTIESCERDILETLVFSSLFTIKISPLLLVDEGTLPNHVKFGVFFYFLVVISFFCLLAVDSLQFFCCRAVNSVFFCYLIGDRSQQIHTKKHKSPWRHKEKKVYFLKRVP